LHQTEDEASICSFGYMMMMMRESKIFVNMTKQLHLVEDEATT